ncbi:acetyltransferase, partial [Lacticaseibacillus rhamnosus]|nr:acetyltransferase [Lacticaseibacillus rhamnosus]MCT3176156.1 acetyltransferase [Lacticaseibacillus rhamnosus]
MVEVGYLANALGHRFTLITRS